MTQVPAQEIADKIGKAGKVVIVTHVFPDGDNIGSGLALLQALERVGQDVSFHLEGEVPKVYRWLPATGDVRQGLPKKEQDDLVIVAIDSSDINRMGNDFTGWYDQRTPLINVDHHASNTNFGHINWVDGTYSSTGEMVLEIIDALGVKLDRDIARCIYCAILTDTGRFGFSNTNLRSIKVASRCVEAGADPHEAYSYVYASRTIGGLRLLQKVLDTLRFFASDRGCAFHVNDEMFKLTGTEIPDTENFLETVTQVRELSITVFFKEVGPGSIKASLRCKDPVNAYELASRFGGGGHPRAAGFTFDGTIEEAYAKFIAEAEKVLASVGV